MVRRMLEEADLMMGVMPEEGSEGDEPGSVVPDLVRYMDVRGLVEDGDGGR